MADDFGIDLEDYTNDQNREFENAAIDMSDYAQSQEAEEASWWDFAKDVVVQPALGALSAFTWPADLLKIGMVSEALDTEELEKAYEKEGKTFDRSKYLKDVAETSQFVPTQGAAEEAFQTKTGISLEPKSKTGQALRKLFFIRQMTSGKGLSKSLQAGAVGSATTQGLKAAGAPEIIADIGGDLAGAYKAAAKKAIPRNLSPEAKELEAIAKKNGLPFFEFMTKEQSELAGPKITEAKKLALEKEIAMTSEKAVQDVIDGKLSISQLKNKGANLETLWNEAYDYVSSLVKGDNRKYSTKPIADAIDQEIARIKSLAPIPSEGQQEAIKLLQLQKEALEKGTANSQQLIQQIKNWNKDVASIYRKSQFSGAEEEIANAYGFVKDQTRNLIEKESGAHVRNAMRAADNTFAESIKLERANSLVMKAFENGSYNPKKLNQLLKSSKGNIVRREIGDQAIQEIKDIAEYGQKAQQAVTQLSKSSKNPFDISNWGPLAGFLFAKLPAAKGLLAGAAGSANYIRGHLLTRNATRTIYKKIMKEAADGSFKNMADNFAKLELEIVNEYGSVKEFIDEAIDDLEIVNFD